MTIRKFYDWSSWWDGMRSKAMKAGAQSLATNLSAMLGSNGVASMIPAMHDYILTWQTAIITTISQFVVTSIWAAAQYVAAQPDPQVVTEEVDTSATSKKDTQ